MKRWDPPVARSEREERLLKLAGKSRKLLVFLRERRHEIFDAGFQAELESMYRDTGAGREPVRPAIAPATRAICSGVSSGYMGRESTSEDARSDSGRSPRRYPSEANMGWRCRGMG